MPSCTSDFDDRGVENRDEFKKVSLAFEGVGEKIGIVRGQGAELVEERLLGFQLPAERKARVAVHESLRAAGAQRGAQRDRRGAVRCQILEIQSGVPQIY